MASQITAQDLVTCESEQIHQIGSIQGHGILFALCAETLNIQYVSSNVETMLKTPPEKFIGSYFGNWLFEPDEFAIISDVRAAIQNFVNPFSVKLMIGTEAYSFNGIANHTADSKQIIVDLEATDLVEQNDLHRNGPVDNYFQFVQRSLRLTHTTEGVVETCAVVAEEVRKFTGFDRVMVYRLSEDYSGEIIAESREEELEPLLGLRYPASDIPKQARELYTRNWVRLLRDVDDEPSPIYPPAGENSSKPLDLSKSVLRSLSPLHIEYLRNMGVSATLTISIVSDDKLWGLIACHNYSPRFVDYRIRSTCALYGVVLSSQIVTKEFREIEKAESNARAGVATFLRDLSVHDDTLSAFEIYLPSLLPVFEADGAAFILEDSVTHVGETPPSDVLLRGIKSLSGDQKKSIIYTDSIANHLEEFASDSKIAGLVLIPISANSHLLFFKVECLQTVRWGGNPNEAKREGPSGRLLPRSSFDEWTESVRGRSLPWSPASRIAVDELRSGLAAFIVRRNIELESLNNQLAKKNEQIEEFVFAVSHDLKSPLVTCMGYADALKDDLESGDLDLMLDSIQRIKKAGVRMSGIINGLLNLCRIGGQQQSLEKLDLSVLVDEIIQASSAKVQESGATLRRVDKLPSVFCDRSDTYRAIENLVVNALNYGCSGDDRRVEIGVGHRIPNMECVYIRDYGKGIEPAYHDRVFEIFQRLSSGKDGSGLGLTSVKKIMEVIGGQVCLDSDVNKGATFWLCFPVREKTEQVKRLPR